MPRPRTVSDEHILEATARAVGRLGPTRLTLAHVGAEAGLSPATLVQRFGSRRGLLLALSRWSAVYAADAFTRPDRAAHPPLERLVEGLVDAARDIRSPEEMANHMALLQLDLTDPEFHAPALAHSRAVRTAVRRLLDEALARGDLEPGCDTKRLARAVHVVWSGVLVNWALHREGTLLRWLREDLDTLLTGWRTIHAHAPAARGVRAPRGARAATPPSRPRRR